MRITFISDTHTKHNMITGDLPGGDLLIHAGDMSSMGRAHEIHDFCKWFESINNYDHKVFIAGNHDWGFIDHIKFAITNEAVIPEHTQQTLNSYKTFDYLFDEWIVVGDGDPHDANTKTAKIYGSPWQPEFYDWAFNLPRQGDALRAVWDKIPEGTDILVTHGPAFGFVDTVYNRPAEHLGCELLTERIGIIKPKIHVCGHIHTGYGHFFDGTTHFINASVLDERYQYTQEPLTADWDPETNELKFL
jgi:Icc-related predicted phosphoesterase